MQNKHEENETLSLKPKTYNLEKQTVSLKKQHVEDIKQLLDLMVSHTFSKTFSYYASEMCRNMVD